MHPRWWRAAVITLCILALLNLIVQGVHLMK